MSTPKAFTSVKVDKDVYEKFKNLSVTRKFYLQDLVNNCLHLFIEDPSFRDRVYNYQVPLLSAEAQASFASSSIANSESSS